MKQLFVLLVVVFLTSGCKGPISNSSSSKEQAGVHKVVVKEVIHAAGYTYLSVSEKRKTTWLAVPGMDVTIGDKISYTGGLEMTDFHSKELNRTFPSILFLEKVTTGEDRIAAPPVAMGGKMGEIKKEKVNISIPSENGSIPIGKLLETKADYSDKKVKVRGKITKINSAIMGKNWIHIQDGTEFNGAFDLTITTVENFIVGDTVTFDGKISLKKDFGYGYLYDIIMEDGKGVK